MMDSSRKARFNEKLSRLDDDLHRLTTWFTATKLEIAKNENDQQGLYAIYHAIQVIAESISDIAAMIVKDLGLIVKDNYSNYEILKQENIITVQILDSLKEINGLRNHVVHDYNGIDDALAWKSIGKVVKDIPKFKQAIKKWLATN